MLNKPLWRLLVDMEPEQLVSTIDFRYLSDVISKEEAVSLLNEGRIGKDARIEELMKSGYPAYTTQVGKRIIYILYNVAIFLRMRFQ